MAMTASFLTRFLLTGVLARAGLRKVHKPTAFAATLSVFVRVHPRLTSAFAVLFGVLEIACCAVLLPPSRQIGVALIGAVLASFLASSIYVLRRNVQVECHCFAGDDMKLGVSTIARSVLLVALLVASFFLHAPLHWAAAVAFATMILTIYLLIDAFIRLENSRSDAAAVGMGVVDDE